MDHHSLWLDLGRRLDASVCLRRKFIITLELSSTWCTNTLSAQNRPMLAIGRVIAGIAVGFASATVPLYQAEITKPEIRGRMVSLQQWSITWGMYVTSF